MIPTTLHSSALTHYINLCTIIIFIVIIIIIIDINNVQNHNKQTYLDAQL